MAATPMAELLTIPMSHYCEKARWALERAAFPYREVRRLQMFHYAQSYRWARTPYVPLLRVGGRTIVESTEIVRFCDTWVRRERRLFPDEHRQEVEALVRDLDSVFGVETRRWMYMESLGAMPADRLVELAGVGVPHWQPWLMKRTFRVARRFLARRLDLTAESHARAAARIEQTLVNVEHRLADGRRYLCGERFSAADLTFAALSAPILLPTRYGALLPRVEELPPGFRARVQGYRERPAGRFALRLIDEERPEPSPLAERRVTSSDRTSA